MNKKGLTSFLTLMGFIIMTWSGLVLYIVPHGRVADWVVWRFWGLTRTAWVDMHVISSILWVVAGAFHIYFNWNVLTSYIYRKAKGGWNLKKEMAVSLLAGTIVVVVSIYPMPPFSYITSVGEDIKNSWVTSPEYEPPFGHAELLSLNVFTKKQNIDTQAALAVLKDKGLDIPDPKMTLTEIAMANDSSPMDIYMAIKHLEKQEKAAEGTVFTTESVEEKFSGTGIGNKTLAQLIEENGLKREEVTARLVRKGIDLPEGQALKQASDALGTTSLDLLKAILVEDFELPK